MKLHYTIRLTASLLCMSSVFADDNTIELKDDVTFSDKNYVYKNNNNYADCEAYARGAVDTSFEYTAVGYKAIEYNGNYVFASSYTNWANTFYTYYAYSYAYGGTLYAGTIAFENNVRLKFNGNYAKAFARSENQGLHSTGGTYSYWGAYAYGGAICLEPKAATNNIVTSLSMRNNTDITFSNNFVEGYNVGGGAIYTTGVLDITGNQHVCFSGNYEYKPSFGNKYVRDDAERSDGSVQLRSIYITPDSSESSLNLGAASGGHITFYDSVYMGNYSGVEVSLNADYKDAEGVTRKAKGDIVFSGKFTEDHLKEIKGGTAGTSTEIANSRTSELLNTVNLYGGTLRVEDKAVLKTHAINVTDESKATVKVTDAEVNASGYDITVNKTGTLEIGGTDGSSKVTAKNIHIEEGATLSLTRTEVVSENVAMTLATVNSLSAYNDKIAGVVSGNLNIAGGATLKADGAHLAMNGGLLTFLASTEGKTNLVLTLGAEYEPDSQIMLFSNVATAKFLQNNITATSTGAMVTLNAADYFTGDWVNDKTTLVYDSGNIYVSGVNVVVPEPTTATLSLLALVGLAARRRRK